MATSLRSEITWKHVEEAFHKSMAVVKPEFFEERPPKSKCRIRTTLQNVVANAVVIMVKHNEGIEYLTEKAALQQIYRLDALTPAPHFVGVHRQDTSLPVPRSENAEILMNHLRWKLSIPMMKLKRLLSEVDGSHARVLAFMVPCHYDPIASACMCTIANLLSLLTLS